LDDYIRFHYVGLIHEVPYSLGNWQPRRGCSNSQLKMVHQLVTS